MPPYEYTELDVSKQEIRLVALQYGTENDDIRCELLKATLDNAPPYEALSYHWGDLQNSRTILLGGHEFRVSSNLEIALRHLQQKSSVRKGHDTTIPRVLWIDALCINQADIEERGQQVQQMYSIYAKASTVLIWLGEEKDRSKFAMSLVYTAELSVDFILCTPELSTDDCNADSFDLMSWVAFGKLMQRPWWRRVWVVQELAAAQSTPWVGCGSEWLPWSDFEKLARAIDQGTKHPLSKALRTLSADYVLIKELVELRRMVAQPYPNSILHLLHLLQKTQSRQATDPRDKVFALLGFVRSVPILPDYSKSVTEMYQSLARTFISHKKSLATILLNRFPKQLNLPSWVPDWSTSFPGGEYNTSIPMGCFGADGNPWHDLGIGTAMCLLFPSGQCDSLLLMGTHYDDVLVADKIWNGEEEKRESDIFDLINQYKETLKTTDSTFFPTFHPEERQEALGQTLIWNSTARYGYPAPKGFGNCLSLLTLTNHRFLNILEYPQNIEANDFKLEDLPRVVPLSGFERDYYESLLEFGNCRRFFITSRGNLGSGPSNMQPGDVVCILFGAKTPVILRRREEEAGNVYTFVGAAYVHGIMEGEAMADIKAGKGKLELFELQ